MITVKIIADSISLSKDRITTFELEYPRMIHSEVMTHRLFSRNAASSRAIPVDTMIDQVLTSPAMPVEWGLNQSGMQAKGVHNSPATCIWAWQRAAARAVESARELQGLGLHKQLVNRGLEAYQMMKTIVTATEFDNFFWLRCHEAAQPEIRVLADKMYELYHINEPQQLRLGEWHVPYVGTRRDFSGILLYTTSADEMPMSEEDWLTLEQAQQISSSCCAQVSYRKLDDSLDKAIFVYDKLVNDEPVHASPFEHVATPMLVPVHDVEWANPNTWQEGITHVDRNNKYWSGNLKGWVQYRQLLDNNTCWEYTP